MLRVTKATTKTITDAKPSRTHTELRSFLGVCNAYRRFVPGFARIVSPLIEMLKKCPHSEFDDLTDEQFKVYQSVKEHLLNPPILALPRESTPYILDTDASENHVG